jgi:hypothetical protein
LRNSLAAALLAAALSAPAAAGVDLSPRPNEIFPLLIADPRHIQTSASYYRLDGQNASDLALGGSWGLTRWRTGPLQDWLWEADVEGMAYSRFLIGGGCDEFQTADFIADLPVAVRRGDVSFKAALFHESSYLDAQYGRDAGVSAIHYFDQGARLQAALDLRSWARAYAGAQYLIHDIPDAPRWSLQSGLEFSADDLEWFKGAPARPFLAQDCQWHQDVGWNTDSHTVLGVKIPLRGSPTRALRVQAGYFTGHSPFGQFYARREHYADLSIAFEL